MIQILVTGGTLDKNYDILSGDFFFGKTHIEEALRVGHCHASCHIQTLMLVDSRHLTDSDRMHICETVTACAPTQVVITHGTDTMEHTAAYLHHYLPETVRTTKTIVLTGAMVPYFMKDSDVLFNLGCAMGYVQSLPPGVYVVMHGMSFAAGRVTKNLARGRFESTTTATVRLRPEHSPQ